MRVSLFSIIFSMVFLVFLVFGIENAFACELSYPLPDIKETYDFADVVFGGKVIEKKQIFPEDGFFEIFFEVQRIWKGLDDNEVSIISWYTGCGAPPDFIEGQTYLVFAEENRYGDGFSNYTNTKLAWISQIVGIFTLDEMLDEKGAGFTPLNNSIGFENSVGEESPVPSLSVETSDSLPVCEQKEKPYDPNIPLTRGSPQNLRIVDNFGNSLSSVFLNQKTFVIFNVANSDSEKCIMEVELFISFHSDGNNTEQILYEKTSKILDSGEDNRLSWDFKPQKEGKYDLILKRKGFPSHETAITVYPPSQQFFPPLKQIENGVLPENVACKNGMTLIFKATDESPACVKPDSIPKLFERGWILNPVKMNDPINTIKINGHLSEMDYSITGGEILSVELSSSVKISLETVSDGEISLKFPRFTLKEGCEPDQLGFAIFSDDGNLINKYKKIISPDTQYLSFSFQNGTKEIEILGDGTCYGMPFVVDLGLP